MVHVTVLRREVAARDERAMRGLSAAINAHEYQSEQGRSKAAAMQPFSAVKKSGKDKFDAEVQCLLAGGCQSDLDHDEAKELGKALASYEPMSRGRLVQVYGPEEARSPLSKTRAYPEVNLQTNQDGRLCGARQDSSRDSAARETGTGRMRRMPLR